MAMEGLKAIEEERAHKPRINLVKAELFHRSYPPENLIPQTFSKANLCKKISLAMQHFDSLNY